MKYELEPYHRNVSNEELLDDLKRVARDLGKDSVTLDEYNECGQFNSSTLTRRFGNWFKALDVAGLQPSRPPINIPNEELFENIAAIWEVLGGQPKYAEVRKPLSKYSAGTYDKHFGSWRKALEAFVSCMNSKDNTEIVESSIETVVVKHRETFHQSSRAINYRLRFLVMRRDNFKCQQCGKSPANETGVVLEVDHIKAWSKGGETVIENLQTLCQRCNSGKSNLDATES
jgi:5-methylcytosine-specific restriction endonuclease McrA